MKRVDVFGRLAVIGMCAVWLFGVIGAAGRQSAVSLADGVYTKEQAKRGEALYSEHCASCHGAEMTGGEAPSLTGDEFALFWNDVSLGDLFERIRIAMPQDNPGSLSGPQIVDIITFILSKGQYPAGTAELPAVVDVLNGIKFPAVTAK